MLLLDEYKKYLDLKNFVLFVNVCFDKYFVCILKKECFVIVLYYLNKKIIILYDFVMSKVGFVFDFLMILLNIDIIYN